jgi:IS30 family transposase
MTKQLFNAAAEVKALKQQMIIARQRRLMQSALTKYRGEIVALLKEGASFRLIAKWLKRNKHLTISHTTIMRFAKKLPELKTDVIDAVKKEIKTESEQEDNHAQLP